MISTGEAIFSTQTPKKKKKIHSQFQKQSAEIEDEELFLPFALNVYAQIFFLSTIARKKDNKYKRRKKEKKKTKKTMCETTKGFGKILFSLQFWFSFYSIWFQFIKKKQN